MTSGTFLSVTATSLVVTGTSFIGTISICLVKTLLIRLPSVTDRLIVLVETEGFSSLIFW